MSNIISAGVVKLSEANKPLAILVGVSALISFMLAVTLSLFARNAGYFIAWFAVATGFSWRVLSAPTPSVILDPHLDYQPNNPAVAADDDF